MNAIPLFKIFGIQVYIDYSWFIAFTLITLTLSQGFYPTLYKNLSQFDIYSRAVSAIMLFY
ncbi:metallopeptidase, M50 family, partial [Sulfurihydrogenibium yellowstonense SS-5]